MDTNKLILDSFNKALELNGKEIKIFKTIDADTYVYTQSIVKYEKQQVQNSTYILTLEDRYIFTMLEPIEINNYIAWNGSFYNVLSIDNTKEGIYKVYTKYYGKNVPIFKLVLDNPSLNIKQGTTANIGVKVYKNEVLLENPSIIYTSSNTDIVTINNIGLITGIAEGDTFVSCNYLDLKATCNIKVNPIVYSITLDNSNVDISENSTLQLNPICKIDGVEDLNPSITYISDNETIATVSPTGLITGIVEGTCIIYCNYNGISATLTVNVKKVVEQIITYDITTTSTTGFIVKKYNIGTFTGNKRINGIVVDGSNLSFTFIPPTGITIKSNIGGTYGEIKIQNTKGYIAGTTPLILLEDGVEVARVDITFAN